MYKNTHNKFKLRTDKAFSILPMRCKNQRTVGMSQANESRIHAARAGKERRNGHRGGRLRLLRLPVT
jgi:hypothetical protein